MLCKEGQLSLLHPQQAWGCSCFEDCCPGDLLPAAVPNACGCSVPQLYRLLPPGLGEISSSQASQTPLSASLLLALSSVLQGRLAQVAELHKA